VRIPQGAALVHGGDVFHGGFPIVAGERYVIVGFVEVQRGPAYCVSESRAAAEDAYAKFGHAAWTRRNKKTAIPEIGPPERLRDDFEEVHLIGLASTRAVGQGLEANSLEKIVEELYKYLHEVLPSMSTERMVDLLEFIAIQNAGIAEMDNTVRRPDIAACCRERPFVISGEGINSLANLVRHAEATCTIEGNPFAYPLKSLEHRTWALVEGALNTAAAITRFDGDALACFAAVDMPGPVRSKYFRRGYARDALVASTEDKRQAAHGMMRLANIYTWQLGWLGIAILVLCISALFVWL